MIIYYYLCINIVSRIVSRSRGARVPLQLSSQRGWSGQVGSATHQVPGCCHGPHRECILGRRGLKGNTSQVAKTSTNASKMSFPLHVPSILRKQIALNFPSLWTWNYWVPHKSWKNFWNRPSCMGSTPSKAQHIPSKIWWPEVTQTFESLPSREIGNTFQPTWGRPWSAHKVEPQAENTRRLWMVSFGSTFSDGPWWF